MASDLATLETDALNAFFTHVSGFTTLPVYWPNATVPGTPADEHYRISVDPVPPSSIDLCGYKYQWLLRVLIHVRDGVGSIKPAEFAGLIRSALPDGTRLTNNNHVFQISDPAAVIPQITVSGWNITPVQCRFFNLD